MKTRAIREGSQESASQTRRNTMIDHQQSLRVNKATEDTVSSFRETSQTVVDSIITIQECYLKMVQSLFLGWMDVLTYQMKSTRTMVEQWEQQSQKWQDGSRRPMSSPMQLYMDFLLTPLTFSRKMVEASMPATQREREPVS
jgi:hypothetical protein